MIDDTSDECASLCHDLLDGKRRIVVWGGNAEASLCEWQRQIQPLFMVDSQWTWWRHAKFHGMDVRSPIEIEQLKAEKTVVVNNYSYSPSITDRMTEFLQRIGGYVLTPPLHLHRICAMSAQHARSSRDVRVLDEAYCRYIDDVLDEILTEPQNLAERKELPKKDMLEAFFSSYRPSDYLCHALAEMRSFAMQNFKAKNGEVALVIGSIDYGGAERQICNLAVALKREGWSPKLYYFSKTVGGERYRNFLREYEVPFEHVGPSDILMPGLNASDLYDLTPQQRRALWYVDAQVAQTTIGLYKKFAAQKPEAVIAYLDATNLYAAYAGVLAGVPKIMLSGRSIEPSNFLHIYGPQALGVYRETYPYFLSMKGVYFSNNSLEGAKSYAKWLGVDEKSISVIPNCVADDFVQAPSPLVVRLRKEQLSLKNNQPFILGVFRFTKEKRAHDFVRIIALVHKKYPKLRAMICGQGPQKSEIEELIVKLKLQHVIHLGGIVEDVPLVMRCSTLLLHTAEIEGSPNVIFEAQASGLPIVCAENGGTRQYLAPEWQQYRHKPGKIKDLAQACIELISDEKGRKAKAAAVRKRALRETTSRVLARRTLATLDIFRGIPRKM